MILRRFVLTLIVSSSFYSIGLAQEAFPKPSQIPRSQEHAQDFSETVVPIFSVKFTPSVRLGIKGGLSPALDMDAGFGTGFCLDPGCRFIVTNYHVAVLAHVHKIKGEKIFHEYLATGPHDQGASANHLDNGGLVPFTMKRDLAIFELRHPLSHHRGLGFNLDEPELGQEVDIYGYPKEALNRARKLTRFPATFKGPTRSGLLAFEYQLSTVKSNRMGGASGGIVVDRKTEKILGILNATSDTMALAVPAQTLVDFVRKVLPFLATQIFVTVGDVSPVSADLYPKFAPSPDHNLKLVPVHSGGLQHRPEEPAEVRALREKAQFLADSMQNFIAVQSFEWGSENKEPAALAEYEVRVIDGAQRFREYPDGNKELDHPQFPPLNGWTLSADEWSRLPTMVGKEFRLKVRQASDVVLNGRPTKVFQYYASVEDNLCPLEPVVDFGLFKISRVVAVACYGEVWTDAETNIIRISEHLELSEHLKAFDGWEEYQIILTYGWLEKTEQAPALVPLTIFSEARYKKKHVYWCRGQFSNYQMFTSGTKLLAAN